MTIFDARKVLSENYIELIEDGEGRRSKLYNDSGGVPTIGIGHVITKSERMSGLIIIGSERVKYSLGLTNKQIDDLCAQDSQIALDVVWNAVTIELTQYQLEALVSFAFNVGTTAFKNSTLLKVLNRGHYAEVPAQLRRWVMDNGEKIPGLVIRRNKEISHWLGL